MAFGVLVSKQVHKIEDSGTSTKFQGAKSSQHSHAPKTSHPKKKSAAWLAVICKSLHPLWDLSPESSD